MGNEIDESTMVLLVGIWNKNFFERDPNVRISMWEEFTISHYKKIYRTQFTSHSIASESMKKLFGIRGQFFTGVYFYDLLSFAKKIIEAGGDSSFLIKWFTVPE